MSEVLRIECADCIDDGREQIWYAIYLAFFVMPIGTEKMINVINQRRPLECANFGGENILNHHNTNFKLDGIVKHSHFRVLRVDNNLTTPIGSLICATSTQMFNRTQ